MKITRENGQTKVAFTKSDWIRIGQENKWFKKKAMSVPMLPEHAREMAEENVYVLRDMFDAMPKGKVKNTRRILQDLQDDLGAYRPARCFMHIL